MRAVVKHAGSAAAGPDAGAPMLAAGPSLTECLYISLRRPLACRKRRARAEADGASMRKGSNV